MVYTLFRDLTQSSYFIFIITSQCSKNIWQVIHLELNQEFQSLALFIYQWFDSTFYTLVLMLLLGGGTSLSVV